MRAPARRMAGLLHIAAALVFFAACDERDTRAIPTRRDTASVNGAVQADDIPTAPDAPDAPDTAATEPDSSRTENPPRDTAVRPDAGGDEIAGARRALQDYYDAINVRDYERAFLVWADSGRALGRTLDEFRDGFRQTKSTSIEIGKGRLEGAAGSRYVEFPVVIRAETVDGMRERFAGTYVLRRSVVDGASPEQRTWHIHSAKIHSSRRRG